MSKSTPYINDIVSLTVMMLMVIALVAGQADAKIHEEALAIDAAVQSSQFRFEDE